MSAFIIPPGSQVVLKYSKRIRGSSEERPAGSVAKVVESPESNRYAYTIEFADGTRIRAKIGELAIRRREVAEELRAPGEIRVTPGEDLRPYIIYRVEVGSRAFGLATEESDEDIRGVYVPPARMTWSLRKPPEQWESSSEGRDEVYWEIEKFLMLAVQANPNILEILWTPIVISTTALGEELRAMRRAFLSKHIYKTYSGYVLSQFRRMRGNLGRTGTYRAKHAVHLIRLLLSGIHALRTGEILVDVGEHREELLSIRRNERTFDQIEARALELDRIFQDAFGRTSLPDRPDYERANEFLIRARRAMVEP